MVLSFEEVYRRFRRPIWSLARRLSGSEDEALDATQEIFLRVWKGLGGFRGESKLSTWVFQIAWNYLRRERRRKGRMPSFLSTDERSMAGTVLVLEEKRAGPERKLGAVEDLHRVEKALTALSEEYRVVLALRDGEDLSYQEISDVLDIPIGTVRSRIARARMKLRKAVNHA